MKIARLEQSLLNLTQAERLSLVHNGASDAATKTGWWTSQLPIDKSIISQDCHKRTLTQACFVEHTHKHASQDLHSSDLRHQPPVWKL